MTLLNGVKYDEEKLRFDLVPWYPIRLMISVLMYGAKKYDDENWKKVTPLKQRYYNALMRHITAWWDGEINDPESGKHHLAHALCCIIFILEGERIGAQ